MPPEGKDLLRDLRVALVAIVDADPAMQGLMGRSTDLLVAWGQVGPMLEQAKPALAYFFLPFEITGGEDDQWRGKVQFTAFSQGNGALALVDKLVGRLVELLTVDALAGQGLDAAPFMLRRLDLNDGQDREDTRRIQRADLEVELDLTKPMAP